VQSGCGPPPAGPGAHGLNSCMRGRSRCLSGRCNTKHSLPAPRGSGLCCPASFPGAGPAAAAAGSAPTATHTPPASPETPGPPPASSWGCMPCSELLPGAPGVLQGAQGAPGDLTGDPARCRLLPAGGSSGTTRAATCPSGECFC
jgi:hypothetical protein